MQTLMPKTLKTTTSTTPNRQTTGCRAAWIFSLACALTLAAPPTAVAQWPQYGGPDADFKTRGGGLAKHWPEAGPPRIWQHDFGSGYAGIVSDGDRLFSMYRIPGDQIDGREDGQGQEVVVALDAASGRRIWQHAYDAPVDPKDPSTDLRYGRGPNSTPLLVGDRLYTLGFTGQLHCLTTATGEVLWSHDLWRGFKVSMPYFGHASSPMRYGSSLIVLAGGAMAFDLESGELRWDNWDIESSYASPRVVRVEGRDQILAPLAGEIAGLDPASGKVLWRHEHANQYKTILSSPIVLDDDRVFVSSAWVGSRSLRIGGDAENGVVEVWHNPKMQISYSNAIRVGDWIYASSGVEVDFLTALNVETGEIGWKERGLAQANLLYADGLFIILDEDGQLILASLTPEKLTIHHRVQLLDSRSWTVPTLVGTRLYVRNEKTILALDLGEPAAVESASLASGR